ncbi:extracellular solute-binding protein [Salinirarus marinus]|uniref:extracellular solute-binding protein n=2 Tax=Haloferacaceae TaxID=1644056 RepID=UPI003C6C67E0
MGAVGTVGLAGCAGGGGGGSSGGDGGSSGGGGSTDGGDSSGGSTTGSSGEWPDLSGKEVHFVTDEASDASKQFWNGVASDFEEATGASTKMEYVGIGTGGMERITQLIQAGDPPEIFTMNAANASTFRSEGVLAPVDDAFDQFTEVTGQPEEQATVKVNGHQWYVPLWFNTVCYYYRSDLSDIVPDTWEKAQAYAKEVDEADNGVRGTYVPAGPGAHVCYRIMSWMYSNEGSFMQWNNDDQIEVAYDSGENRTKLVETLNYIKERQQYSPVASDSNYTTWSNSIPNEVAGSTPYSGFRPVVQSVTNDRSFAKDVSVVPGMPKAPSGTNRSVAASDGMGTFKGADQEAARAFINFTLQEEYLTDLYMMLTPVHNVPAFPEFRSSTAYQDALKGLEGWPTDAITTYQEDVKFKTRPNDTDPPNPYAGASYASPPLWNMQVDLLVKDKSPEAVIDEYAPKHQEIIDEAQN